MCKEKISLILPLLLFFFIFSHFLFIFIFHHTLLHNLSVFSFWKPKALQLCKHFSTIKGFYARWFIILDTSPFLLNNISGLNIFYVRIRAKWVFQILQELKFTNSGISKTITKLKRLLQEFIVYYHFHELQTLSKVSSYCWVLPCQYGWFRKTCWANVSVNILCWRSSTINGRRGI